MFGIPEKLVDNTKVDLLFFDFHVNDNIEDINNVKNVKMSRTFDDNDNNNKISIDSLVKSLLLDEISSDFNEEKHIVEYLINNIKTEETIDFNIIKPIENSNNSLFRKIVSKILIFSNQIAVKGRMGSANSLIINTQTLICNSTNADALLKALLFLKDEHEINFYLSDYVPINQIYLMRNGSMNDPGFKILRHTDINNKDYFKIDGFGWFPDLQAMKINIIPLESKKESIIDIKNIENVFTNRTMSLSEYGLFIIYNIGVAGLSQARAQEEVETLINDYTDININEISKYFKFYKEIWLTNNESQKSTVEIKLI